jgi:hypothetical protein
LTLGNPQVQADLYLLTDQPISTSDRAAILGQSLVGAEIPGAPGFKVAFQEKLTPTLFHDLSTDRNMGWVRSDSWFTYLSLDASPTTVTYDMGISSTGVIRLAPYGTPPMAVVDGYRLQGPATWLPMGTTQMLLSLLFALGIGGALVAVIRARARLNAKRAR